MWFYHLFLGLKKSRLSGLNKGNRALVLKAQVDRDKIATGGLVGKYSGVTLHASVAVGSGQRDSNSR